MPWDTETTRRRLLEAGARQFAAHGYAGTSMDAIGRDSGVNKERVYRYFGDKRAFFAAVLARKLTGLLDGADVRGSGPDAVAEFAGWMFDRFRDSPALTRLLAWESLELDAAVAAEARRPLCASHAAQLQRALPGSMRGDIEQLMLSIISLAASWTTLVRVADVVLTVGANDHDRRAAIMRHARAAAAQLTSG
ncbi:TetR/AcrR family transcriptional regulator [Microbacterium karelineae]|uniref:TetR/AcrR family transcriptional regulator n=1 Tax=Microbacterium karelineae TaxID=2654283 RepID=UPI0012EA6D7F|nr:TetR/AcrR family transcriptional regulator [Microbacterium karelineae]